MAPKVIWLFVFVALYWSYCITMGVKGARMAHTSDDYFLAGRKVPLWVFVLAVTAASFSGWTFMGHPAMLFRDGFQYAQTSLYAIVIPLTGVLFLKRQWILGRRYGYVTPGEMFSDYFRGDAIRILTVVVALVFSIPYLGLQLGAAGYLFDVLTDGLVTEKLGMWILAIVMLIYIAAGGLRSVAYVDALQCVLLAFGVVMTGIIALSAAGGWDALQLGLAKLGGAEVGRWGTTMGEGGGNYDGYFAIPGVIQLTAGYGRETPVGGLWTGVMGLTFLIAMMGIQSAPAFTMWAFANRTPRAFAPQQVWASAFGIGLCLVLFATIQGVGAHVAGADPAANRIPGIVHTLLKADSTRIVPAPEDPAALVALYDAGAVPLVAEAPLGRQADEAMLARALERGTKTADDADRIAQIGALTKIGIARDKIAELVAEPDNLDRFVRENRELGQGFLAVYRAERRALLPAMLAGAQFVVTPLPSGPLAEKPDALVPYYFNLIADRMPILVALLAMCAIAAMQSTSAVYTSTAASMLSRDLFKTYVSPTASSATQRMLGRVGVGLIVVAALAVAMNARETLVLLGGIAVAYGLQMWVPLAGVTWFPWITRRGATWGLFAGLLAVTFTEPVGLAVLSALHLDFWGRWPLTVHSAGWGILVNVVVCCVISSVAHNEKQRTHRGKYHTFLREHAELSKQKRALKPVAWAATLAWLFFAAGPGAVIGNDLFGAPDANLVDGVVTSTSAWTFGMPSLWVWQILSWASGVVLIWFLAYRMEMSVVKEESVRLLLQDERPADEPPPAHGARAEA